MKVANCGAIALVLMAVLGVRAYGQTTGLQPGSPWPKLHGSAANTGESSAPCAVGVKRWAHDTGGWVGGPIVGSDGTVYAESDAGCLYAFDGYTGVAKWTFQNQYGYTSSPAIGADGTVYFESYNEFYALDGATGSQKWAVFTLADYEGSSAIGSDGTVYLGCNGDMCAFNGQTGAQLWSFPTHGGLGGSPAVGPDGTVYFGSGDSNLYALYGLTGNEKWAYTATSTFQSDPIIGANGNIYVGGNDGHVFSLDAATGRVNWDFSTVGWGVRSPALADDGTVYVGTTNGYFYAIDAILGTQKWVFQGGENVMAAPAIASDGTVYIGVDDSLFALNPSTGARKWVIQTKGLTLGSPAIGADGTVYFGSTDGSVYAIAPLLVSTFCLSSNPANGGTDPRGVIQLNAAARANETITLSSSSSDAVVPAVLSLPAGSTGVSFTVKTATVSSPEAITLTTNLNSAASEVAVTINPNPLLRFYCSQSSFVGRGSTTGVVQLSGAAGPAGNLVSVASSNPDVVAPSEVTVSAGTIGVSFPIAILPASGEEMVTLTASSRAISKELALHLSPYPISSFYASSPSLTGGLSTRGVIQLAGKAGANGDAVILTPSNSSVQVPSTVTLAAGETGISFPIGTSQVLSTSTVTIAASLGSSGRSLTLTLEPNSLSSFYVSPASLTGGTTTHGVVQLVVPASPSAVTVYLTSSDPHVVVPPRISIPSTGADASFQIGTSPVSSPLPVTLTATFGGSSKQATVSLTP